MRQYRLSTIFLAMSLIGGNLAIARWEIESGIVSAAMTIAVVTISGLRRLKRSRLASAFLGIAAATIGAALYCSCVSSLFAFSKPPNGGTWMFGGGIPMIIGSGVLGGLVGLVFGGIPVAAGYALLQLLRLIFFDRYIRYDFESNGSARGSSRWYLISIAKER